MVGSRPRPSGVREHAAAKLAAKRVDLIVANDVSAADSGFEVDTNRALVLDAAGGGRGACRCSPRTRSPTGSSSASRRALGTIRRPVRLTSRPRRAEVPICAGESSLSRHTFTSESVTEGHPDKMADAISDSVLDAVLTEDPYGRVACETLVTTGLCVVAGEISTKAHLDIARIARDTINASATPTPRSASTARPAA